MHNKRRVSLHLNLEYYEGQIYKLNQNVENILYHESKILDFEFQLGK